MISGEMLLEIFARSDFFAIAALIKSLKMLIYSV